MSKHIIRIGTRASALALWQTQWVADQLTSRYPDIQLEIKEISTTGDRVRNRPIFEASTVGVFVKELEAALFDGEIDIAVHSLKDLPSKIIPGLVIAAVPKREDPRDVLVSRHGVTLEKLPPGAKVGTSSRRRMAQVLVMRPDLEIIDIRGNVDTRLNKAMSEPYDAIVLAMAGIKRLDREESITQILPIEVMLPAAGQGALATETREEDEDTRALVFALEHRATRLAIEAERKFLEILGGGCHAPVGAFAEIKDNALWLRCFVANVHGTKVINGSAKGALSEAKDIGRNLAIEVLDKGARNLF